MAFATRRVRGVSRPSVPTSSDGPAVVAKLSGLGLELLTVTVAASDGEKDLLRRFGEALGFPVGKIWETILRANLQWPRQTERVRHHLQRLLPGR